MSEHIETAVAAYIRAKKISDPVSQEEIRSRLMNDGIVLEDTDSGVIWRRQQYDLLRSGLPGSELIMVNQFKSGEFIAENPSFSIVGIGLPREATDTPYGKIGAVLE